MDLAALRELETWARSFGQVPRMYLAGNAGCDHRVAKTSVPYPARERQRHRRGPSWKGVWSTSDANAGSGNGTPTGEERGIARRAGPTTTGRIGPIPAHGQVCSSRSLCLPDRYSAAPSLWIPTRRVVPPPRQLTGVSSEEPGPGVVHQAAAAQRRAPAKLPGWRDLIEVHVPKVPGAHDRGRQPQPNGSKRYCTDSASAQSRPAGV